MSNTLPTNEYEMRKLLNQLSKEVYGTSSKWQKLVNKGLKEAREPSEDNKATHTTRRPSLTEVYEHMVDAKRDREAQMKAYQDGRDAAKAKSDLENSLSGSAAL